MPPRARSPRTRAPRPRGQDHFISRPISGAFAAHCEAAVPDVTASVQRVCMTVDSGGVYHSESEWHHGVFYIATAMNVIANYVLWNIQGDCVILLGGSPADIIGQNTPTQGLTSFSTNDVLSPLGSMWFLSDIRNDQEKHFCRRMDSPHCRGRSCTRLGGIKRNTFYRCRSAATVLAHRLATYGAYRVTCDFSNNVLLSLLRKLTLARVDTVFKIFSTFKWVKGDCLADLRAEYEADRKELDRDHETNPNGNAALRIDSSLCRSG
jgi:hypothetical protein